MNKSSLQLESKAAAFLAANGLHWRQLLLPHARMENGETVMTEIPLWCLVTNPDAPDETLIEGMMVDYLPDGRMAWATVPLNYRSLDALTAARELLCGDFELLLTGNGVPLILEWEPALKKALLKMNGPQLQSSFVRAALAEKIRKWSF